MTLEKVISAYALTFPCGWRSNSNGKARIMTTTWQLYLKSPTYAKDTQDKRKRQIEAVWREFETWLGQRTLSAELIAEWLKKRCVACSNKTYDEYLRIIRQVIKAVLSKLGLPCNPADEVPVRRKNSISRKPYTKDEIEAVLTAIEKGIEIPYRYKTHGRIVEVMRPYSIPYPQEIRLTVMLGAWCGMRCGDAIRMANTNYSNGFLTYTPSKTEKTSGKEVVVPVLKDELKQAFENCDGWLTPNVRKMYLKNPSELSRLYHRIFEACGLQTRQKCDGRNDASTGGFHALRHSFAYWAAESGVDISVTKDVLGHSSCKTTEIYLHISQKRKALELSKLMSPTTIAI